MDQRPLGERGELTGDGEGAVGPAGRVRLPRSPGALRRDPAISACAPASAPASTNPMSSSASPV